MLTFALAMILSPVIGRTGDFAIEERRISFAPLAVPNGCRRALPKLKRLCTAMRYRTQYRMEAAFADLDNDGRQDVVIRFMSSPDCGSGGCATEIYLSKSRGSFQRAALNIVTDGRIARCRTHGQAGVTFPDRRPGYVCFALH